MPELRDGDPDLGDDENAHDEEQQQIGGEQPDCCAKDPVPGKDKCPDQNQLQAGFEKEEGGVSLDLLERPEIVVLEKIYALQKDGKGENLGERRPAIEECGG